ncbi:MAG: ATP-binding cassette domain-containing protein [Anaerovoracaceae bacterium]|nr:ATP-binding cassette domain-containing protein [Anaerovoracaceae bacterium]
MIKLKGVNKYFNKGKKNQIHVINDTTLELGSKGLVALLGPSGSGKTTMLNAIGGLDKVNSGDIFVDGVKITSKSASKIDEIRNLNIGYIFQDYKLIDNMTIYENVAMVLRMIGIKDEEEIKKRINYILETLGIYRYRNRMADMLSGGERQRVGIARAIAKNPKIIIADEPTGNLDSANSIEIMNIIKAISREKLVVLVTHEVELAKFYASRIIEIKDGKVIDDYHNNTDDNLDYKLDNKFYLKDFEKNESLSGNSLNVNFYGNKEDSVNMDIVVKNGNIYIKSHSDMRVEVVDSNSAIEFVDDHYKEMDKSLYESYKFDFDKVIDSNMPEKYSSIIGFFPSLIRGFKKIASYPLMKKLLFAGFLLSGVFITYAMSSMYASLDVKDKDFVKSNKEYLEVEIPKISVEKYLEYESMDAVKYMFPKSASVNMYLDLNFYYQTSGGAFSILTGDLTDINSISEEDLIMGRMPENPYELVIDKMAAERMLNMGESKQVGINSVEQLIGKPLSLKPMNDFTVVGITDKAEPLIYAEPSLFTDMIYNSYSDGGMDGGENTSAKIFQNYETWGEEYTLKKGRLPENDYEVLVPYSKASEMPLNKQIETKVNGQKLKVVGYYENPDNSEIYLVNGSTIKYALITESKSFDVAPSDKESAMSYFQSQNINVKNTYEKEKEEYIAQQKKSTRSTIILGIVMIAVSLVEILLMIRSSFLSRIKEIGIYRAIGVKKTDIYKMFLGEIFAITTVSSLVGIGIMTYILSKLCNISYLSSMIALNPVVIGGAILTVYLFNSIVGLIPVFTTMRKTPAAILARHDVD